MRRRLVLCDDGVGLQGSVAALGRDGVVSFSPLASSASVEPDAALRDVLAALRARGRVPPRTLLLTAEAVCALVRLPLPAGRARRPDEMERLVRWELEPWFAQHSAARPLGSILRARGLLDPHQVARVLEVVEERRARAGGREPETLRFGAVARELGYVDEEQVRECLALQRRLVHAPSDYACGWSAQPARGDDREPGSAWFAAGLPREVRDAWKARCAAQGLRLAGIYPLLGSAAAALGHDPARRTSLVQIDRDQVACSVLRDGAVESHEVVPLRNGESIRSVLGEPGAAAWQVCGRTDLREDGARLATDARLDARAIRAPEGTDPARLAAAAGAVRHAAGAAPAPLAVRVPAGDLRLPLARRPAVRAAAVALLLLAGAFAGDRALAGRLDDARARLRERSADVDRIESAVEERRAAGREAARLLEETVALRERSRVLEARLALRADGIARRRTLVPRLLDAFARAATRDVLLRRIEEVRPGRIEVAGMELSDAAAQRFVRAVSAEARALGLRVEHPEVRVERLGRAEAYAFSFRLVRGPAAEVER